MTNYISKKLSSQCIFIVYLDYECVDFFKNIIVLDPIFSHFSGDTIIDQLFITGNGHNRFLQYKIVNGICDINSAKHITTTNKLRKISQQIFFQHQDKVENSILTRSQKLKIYNGESI